MDSEKRNDEVLKNVPLTSKVESSKKDEAKSKLTSKPKTEETCLNLIEKVISKFKSQDQEFIDLLSKILDIFTSSDSKIRILKSNLLAVLTANMADLNAQELEHLKKDMKGVFLSVSLVKFFVDIDDIKIATELFLPHILGCGIYSTVCRGTLLKNGTTRTVAIKLSNSHPQILRDEAIILSQFNHPNVLKMLAVDKDVTKIALEYMDCGNLQMALLHKRITVTTKNLMKLLVDIATGMEYIHAQNILHRDLACRNIFLNKNECKVGDFHLSVYVGDSNGEFLDPEEELPRDNMSPASVETGKFTFKCDVWSMGILCWEMFETGSNPSLIHPIYKCAFMENVRQGYYKLACPRLCPKVLFSFITEKLLHGNPSERPNFTEIKTIIKNMKF